MEKDLIIKGKEKDLGGFSIVRSIPTLQKRFVGPFIFLDHLLPTPISEKSAMDVRPHPHIGLATVTYLFSGQGFHQDSLGSKQVIRAGDLNWMTAGRGIVHSERTPLEDRKALLGQILHGVQIWIGLPTEYEECEPSFKHYAADQLPEVVISKNCKAKILLGRFQDKVSPVEILSPTLFLELILTNFDKKSVQENFKFSESEIAFFITEGQININGQDVQSNDLVVIKDRQNINLKFENSAKIIVIGGEPFKEQRHMWWNFVSSKKELIGKAALAWKQQTFGKVPGETEFISLPDDSYPR